MFGRRISPTLTSKAHHETGKAARPALGILVGLVALLAACGGASGSGASSAGDNGGASAPAVASADTAAGASAPAAASADTAADESVEACDLLTDADIEEVTGWGVASTEAGSVMGIYANGCTWVLDGGSGFGGSIPAEIVLGVRYPGGRSYYDTYFVPYVEENDLEPLEGVGDVGLVNTFLESAMAVQGDLLADVSWYDGGESGREITVRLLERIIANAGG